MAAQASSIELDGRTLRITNRDKVMYPETGTTKGDVIDYYAAVARWMVPHVAGRPATRKRWVHGVEAHAFFSKNADSGTPDWVRTVTMQHSRDALRYPVIDDASTLVFLAQLAALEIHVPQWRFGPDGTPAHPDRLVLDLDPGEGAGMAECVEVALIIKEILDGVGLVSVPVTSGSKGIHLYAGLDGHLSSAEASDVARQLALALQASHPGLVVADMKKDLRGARSCSTGRRTTAPRPPSRPTRCAGGRTRTSPPRAPGTRSRPASGSSPTPTCWPGWRRSATPCPCCCRTPRRPIGSRPTAPNGTLTGPRSRCPRRGPPERRPGTRSSSRSITRGGSTTTSGWSGTASWCRGRCRS